MTQRGPDWVVDPDDPRAPPTDVWQRMTPAQRAAVVDALPSEFPATEAHPPEGDRHLDAFTEPREALRRWFRGRGRSIYVAGNLPIYYPGERMFSPDLIAVDGAEQRDRDSWIVDNEGGKGLDVAIEIVVRGKRRKDLQVNVERYANLGIPEYYLFDRAKLTLAAWELDSSGRTYRPRLAQRGRFHSTILGLDMWLDGERLRFSVGDAAVPVAGELIERVERLAAEAAERAQSLEAQLLALEQEREEEQRLREEAEAEIARLRAENERLRGKS